MPSAPLRRGLPPPVLVTPGHGVFTGYASLFNHRDQAGDIVLPGAFRNSLKIRGSANIRMLFQHDAAEPIGTWLDIREDARGLFVRGRINSDVQRGRELISLLATGGLDGLSIGFKTVIANRDKRGGARQLLAVDLWEISLVTFPMLDGARISETKLRARARADAYFTLSPVLKPQGTPNGNSQRT